MKGSGTNFLAAAASLAGIAPGDFATADATVGSTDVTDVQLLVQPNGVVAGRIVVDPGAAGTPVPPPAAFRVTTTAKEHAMAAFPNSSGMETTRDDYSFELTSHPIKSLIQVLEMPAGWTVKSIRQNGTDVLDAGIDVKANARIEGITIEITTRMTDVSGQVSDSHGARVKQYAVVVFARDRERWALGTRYVRSARADQDGRFVIRGLPPGAYYALAVGELEPGDSVEPEFLDRMRSQATAFSLGDGEAETLDLQIVHAR